VHDGVRGIVIDADSGEPLSANISVQGIDHDILPDPENGDYYRLLSAGTYTITAGIWLPRTKRDSDSALKRICRAEF